MHELVIDKEKIEKILKEFPDEVVLEGFIDRVILTAKIEKALEQVKNGEVITEEELEDEIKRWN